MFRLILPRMRVGSKIQIRRSYLSNEFKNTIGMFPNKQTENSRIVLTDIVHSFAAGENKQSEASEKLLKLRSKPQCAFAFEATNFAIIRHFVDVGSVEELVSILKDPLNCGVLLDRFTGCYLLNYLLQEKYFEAATEISVEMYVQELLDNRLVAALILTSFFEFLKQTAERESSASSATKPEEVKVRVKFVRNVDPNMDLKTRIGKAICRIAALCPNDVKFNAQILGLLLENKHTQLLTMLKAKDANFCPDILNLCQSLAKQKDGIDENFLNIIKEHFEKSSTMATFENMLSSFLKQTVKDEEDALIKYQQEKYNIWSKQQFSDDVLDVENTIVESRKKNLKSILEQVAMRKQKLWYFEIEEKIDLEIFKKDKRYPKRWFGKKKQPRVVDDGYIPPEIKKRII